MKDLPFLRTISQFVPQRFYINAVGKLQSEPPSIKGFYPDFPFLYLSSGKPWSLGNSYLVKYAEDKVGVSAYNSETIYSSARSLLDYAAFLEEESLDPLEMPVDKFDRPTFPDFSFHDLRATFAVNLLNLELDFMTQENARLKAGGAQEAITISDCLHVVRKAMGHSSLTTTEQYLQFRRSTVTATFKDQLLHKYSLSMLAPKGVGI